jgi:hypothetical protein
MSPFKRTIKFFQWWHLAVLFDGVVVRITKISTTRNATMSRQPPAHRSQTFGVAQIPLA